MSWNIKSLVRRVLGDERAAVAVIAGFGIVAFVGFAAIVVDVGYLVYARRVLQASTDAAALAGAQDINKGSVGTATATATSYSAVSGNRNATANLTITMASGFPQLVCFTSTGIACSGSPSSNGIRVKQTADVPLFFGKVLGMNSATISASAAAGSAGGAAQPIDVIIILDTTGSMNTTDTTCGVSNATRLSCAFNGFRTLLTGFVPSMDHVGLMIFPGLRNSTTPTKTAAQNAALEYDCSSSTPESSAVAPYNASANPPTTQPPLYLILGLSSDYKTSDAATTLNTSSNLVKAARGGASGCRQGVRAYGGVGTFYADAVQAAKTYLTANGRSGVQKVIIFLGDGDAQASSGNMISSKRNNQCQQAITQAQAATTAGMIVITVAYGAPTSTSGSCPTDASLSACEALRQMASSADRFYSDNANSGTSCNSAANSISDLDQIFQHIGTTIGTGARLLPDSTT